MTKTIIVFSFLFLIFLTGVNAQINTDSIFSRSILSAQNKQYATAVESAKKALQTDSKRGDIMVFVANVYAWQNMPDSALVYIKKAQEINYHQTDFYESWTNILLWSHQYNALLAGCDEAEKYNYSAEDILKKRLIAHNELKNYDLGIRLAELPENKIFILSEPVSSIYSNLLLKRNSNLLAANYSIDFFDAISPQHLGSLGYSFLIGKQSMGFRANYANRFNRNDLQLETDFYLHLGNKQYMYFNYGYGFNYSLFPRHRVGFEYYIPLKYKIDVSIGGRYLNYTSSQVIIITGNVGKYINRSSISLRPYYVVNAQRNQQSFSLIGNYRFFAKNEINFWGLELGFGNSPDDRYSNSQTLGFNQLTAYKLKVERNLMLNRISDIRIGFGYTREEFITNLFRNRYTLELGYKLRLK